jgi:hypothetical protein
MDLKIFKIIQSAAQAHDHDGTYQKKAMLQEQALRFGRLLSIRASLFYKTAETICMDHPGIRCFAHDHLRVLLSLEKGFPLGNKPHAYIGRLWTTACQ